MNTIKALALSAAVLGGTAASADAATKVVTSPLPNEALNYNGSAWTIPVAGFDTALGTLESVFVQVSFTGAATTTIKNNNSYAATATTARSVVDMYLTGPDGTLADATYTSPNWAFGGGSGVSVAGNTTNTYNSPSINASNGQFATTISDYENTSSVKLVGAGTAAVTGSGDTGLEFGTTAAITPTFTITYTYDPVPAPIPGAGALSLAFFVLAGLGPMLTKSLRGKGAARG